MLINERHLNMLDLESRRFLTDQMKRFLAGEAYERPAGYVPPEGLTTQACDSVARPTGTGPGSTRRHGHLRTRRHHALLRRPRRRFPRAAVRARGHAIGGDLLGVRPIQSHRRTVDALPGHRHGPAQRRPFPRTGHRRRRLAHVHRGPRRPAGPPRHRAHAPARRVHRRPLLPWADAGGPGARGRRRPAAVDRLRGQPGHLLRDVPGLGGRHRPGPPRG